MSEDPPPPTDQVPQTEPLVLAAGIAPADIESSSSPSTKDLEVLNAIKQMESRMDKLAEQMELTMAGAIRSLSAQGAATMIARLGESVDQLEASMIKDKPGAGAAQAIPTYCILKPYFGGGKH